MLMQIFFPGSQPSTNMPFGFVHVQNLSCRTSQCRINLKETLSYILMYSTFTYPKLLCCLPHRGIIFYNIISDLHGSFFNIIFQKNPPANIVFTMYAKTLLLIPFSYGCKFFYLEMFIYNSKNKYKQKKQITWILRHSNLPNLRQVIIKSNTPMQAYGASNLQRCKHRGIRPLRQWPNRHVNKSPWLVTRGNKHQAIQSISCCPESSSL